MKAMRLTKHCRGKKAYGESKPETNNEESWNKKEKKEYMKPNAFTIS